MYTYTYMCIYISYIYISMPHLMKGYIYLYVYIYIHSSADESHEQVTLRSTHESCRSAPMNATCQMHKWIRHIMLHPSLTKSSSQTSWIKNQNPSDLTHVWSKLIPPIYHSFLEPVATMIDLYVHLSHLSFIYRPYYTHDSLIHPYHS